LRTVTKIQRSRASAPASADVGPDIETRSARPDDASRPEQRPVPELAGPVVDLVDVDVLGLGVLEDAVEAELAADAEASIPN